jgi:hypothetical protein
MGEGVYLLMAPVAVLGLGFVAVASKMRTRERGRHGTAESRMPIEDAG